MISKSQLKQCIESLPESFTLNELMERLVLISKIDLGNEQSEKGETLSDSEVDEEVKKWFLGVDNFMNMACVAIRTIHHSSYIGALQS